MKTTQATRKNILPNIAQKLPILAMQKPTADIRKSIQPMKLICLLLIVTPNLQAGDGRETNG